MYDIISFSPSRLDTGALGYEKIYEHEKAKTRIMNAKTLAEAAKHKNREVLIALESYDFDEGAIKIIAEKRNACFIIDLSRIISTYGIARAILLSKIRMFLKRCNKHGAFYAFADFAKNEFELRSARELMHISLLLGLNPGQAKFAMEMLGRYLE